MRKVVVLLVLAFLVFIGNFTMWFWHTHSIKDALSQLKKELAYNNIQLSYSEVVFSNFKSWRVTGRLENLDISYGVNNHKKLHLNSLNFTSQPLKKKLKFSTQDHIEVIEKEAGVDSIYDIIFNDPINTRLDVRLDYSMRQLVDLFQNHEAAKLHIIKSVDYKDSGLQMLNKLTNLAYLTTGPNYINISTESSDVLKQLNAVVSVNSILVNKDYKPADEDIPSFMVYTKSGNISVKVDFSFIEKPSALQQEMMNNAEFKKKGIKPVLDSYHVDVREVSYNTDLFQSKISGQIDKQPTVIVPNLNLDFNITSYEEFLNYHMDLYNIQINEWLTESPLMPVSKLANDRRTKMVGLFKNIGAVSDKNLDIKITKESSGDILVSGKPLFALFTDFQNILDSQ